MFSPRTSLQVSMESPDLCESLSQASLRDDHSAAATDEVISLPEGYTSDHSMADPFEVRMRFTSQLQHLNASVTSAQKAAHYALKYKDMDEDLHSCILEQLERNSMNNRANIMYFIEHLCDMAQRENHLEYVRMMQRDILHVVDAVVPEDGSGAANVKVIRKVLNGLQQKSMLEPQIVMEIEACLKERDTLPSLATLSPTPANVEDTSKLSAPATNNGAAKPDKKQIEQRIEEDRERHKRARENIWAINHDEEDEFNRMWEDTSSLGEDDLITAHEEGEDRAAMSAIERAERMATADDAHDADDEEE